MKKILFSLAFVVVVNLLAGVTSLQAQMSVDTRMNGSWYDPAHTGEGFLLEVLNDNRAVVYWFTYDEAGAQRWFIGIGEVAGDTVVFEELLAGSGAGFGPGFDPDDVVLSDVGNLTLSWHNCSEAVADYTVLGVAGSQNLDRLTHVAGLECGVPGTDASPKTGSWFDNTHVGEGLAIEVLSDGRALVYWFSYDPEGNPAWFFGVADTSDSDITIEQMYVTRGGRFGPDFNPDEVEIELWGSANIELGCEFGKMDYAAEPVGFGTGKQTLTRLTSLGVFDCEEPKSPNILLVIADDLGVDASNQYNIAAQMPLTPTLDGLANQGLVFENAWSYPTCTPTRSSILTGKYGARTGVLEVGDVLSTDETSLQSFIGDLLPGKYTDAVIGKWHVGPGRNPDHPTQLGIGYYAGIISGGVEAYDNWQLTMDGVQTNESEYTTSKFVDLAIDWTDQQEKPWFLWLAFNAPHTPFHLPPNNLHSWELSGSDQDISNNPLPYYLASIEAMDTEIGRLLDSLDAETRDNTIVIFLGDNGTPGQVAQAPFTRQTAKGSLYQGGINVPMFISGPGVSRFGDREAALVNTTDIFSTIASLAGVNVAEINDSISFAGLLDGEREEQRSFQYSENVVNETEEWAISDGDYKLIESASSSQELYHVTDDPYESDDLLASGTAPEGKVAELQSLVEQIKQLEN
jgi:arylsulfatase A-like enzyme